MGSAYRGLVVVAEDEKQVSSARTDRRPDAASRGGPELLGLLIASIGGLLLATARSQSVATVRFNQVLIGIGVVIIVVGLIRRIRSNG